MKIEIDKLVYTYTESNKILTYNKNISLHKEGYTVLQGASGSGKTTLLHLLGGVISPDSGTIHGINHDKTLIMFQEPRLFPWRTLTEHLTDIMPKKQKNQKKLAESYLSLVGLEGEAKQKPTSLSGGMGRRLSFARALAYGTAISAELYLFDEPFTGVDSKRILQFLEYLSALEANIIIASHLPLVEEYANQVVVL